MIGKQVLVPEGAVYGKTTCGLSLVLGRCHVLVYIG